MEMLGLKETVYRQVQMAKANGVRWYGHVLRRDDGRGSKDDQRRRGRHKWRSRARARVLVWRRMP